ncbi:hypothetical protein BV911_03920 [Pseudoruegeria sp. SK021]|nr:hypothetical protein BV911_03920 [Pseudoruegeria sp. SK021]
MIIVLIVVLIWMFLTFKARQRTRDCRWRENHSKDTPEGRYFICMNCGAEQFAADGMPPPICYRDAPKTSGR